MSDSEESQEEEEEEEDEECSEGCVSCGSFSVQQAPTRAMGSAGPPDADELLPFLTIEIGV